MPENGLRVAAPLNVEPAHKVQPPDHLLQGMYLLQDITRLNLQHPNSERYVKAMVWRRLSTSPTEGTEAPQAQEAAVSHT